MRALALVCALAGAAHAEPITGAWSGAIDVPGHPLDLVVTFDGNGNGLVDVPAQHAQGMKLDHVVVTGDHVTFGLAAVGATFDGTLGPNGLTGTMTQHGQKVPFHLARGAAPKVDTYVPPPPPRVPLSARVGARLVGEWRGTVATEPIVMTFTAQHDQVGGTADAPRQCDPVATLSNLSLTVDKLHVEITGQQGKSYLDGAIAGDAIDGNLSIRGSTLPVHLERAPAAAPPTYRELEVSVPSTKNAVLAGTLTMPATPAKPPVVVLITGSGPENRDECVFGVRPFAQLAAHLAAHHIATLRLDDRGTAKSTGDFKSATAADFADDTQAAIGFLAGREDVDVKHLGVLGHSEGGIIGPMVAARDRRVAFVVMWAGPGVPLDEVIQQQAHDISLADGVAPKDVARQDRISAATWKAFRAARDERDFLSRLTTALTALHDPQLSDAAASATAFAAQIWTPWFRWYNGYDPRKALAKLVVPVLALNGGMDLQVSAKVNLPAIKRALAHDRDVTVTELPGLNHLFQRTTTGRPSEYGTNSPVLDPAVLDATSAWIEVHSAP